jgi:hypothetical protein
LGLGGVSVSIMPAPPLVQARTNGSAALPAISGGRSAGDREARLLSRSARWKASRTKGARSSEDSGIIAICA